MKALSVKQPWAEFIRLGIKDIETRTWYTPYRGDLLIVASKQPVFRSSIAQCPECYEYDLLECFDVIGASQDNVFCPSCGEEIAVDAIDASIGGNALCIVTVINCRKMALVDENRARCQWYPEAYSWELANLRQIKPFPVKGALGIYEVNTNERIQLL